jgi:hypothetical protein
MQINLDAFSVRDHLLILRVDYPLSLALGMHAAQFAACLHGRRTEEARVCARAEAHGARRQQLQQQFAAVPEQQDVQEWPLGTRAQQPYPAAAGQVMQAFRGITLQVRD